MLLARAGCKNLLRYDAGMRVTIREDVPDLPVYGDSGTMSGVDLSSGAALRELMDAADGAECTGRH